MWITDYIYCLLIQMYTGPILDIGDMDVLGTFSEKGHFDVFFNHLCNNCCWSKSEDFMTKSICSATKWYIWVINIYAIDIKTFILIHNLVVNEMTESGSMVAGGQANRHFDHTQLVLFDNHNFIWDLFGCCLPCFSHLAISLFQYSVEL